MKLTEFYNTDYVDYSSYDNLRKIASLVDGQKNAARKIVYTVLENKINKKIKVSQLGSKVAEYAEYLHGSLENVVVNMAKDYAGTNNLPLLQKKGNFGTRFTPEASAPRYIYTYGTDEFFELFKPEDNDILKHQTFEGNKIEPMFYVPTLPLLMINGSEGVSSGFAQKILPRSVETVIDYIKAKINNEETPALIPHFNDFRGNIEKGEHKQWIINGIVEKKNANTVVISELPVGYLMHSKIKARFNLMQISQIMICSDSK